VTCRTIVVAFVLLGLLALSCVSAGLWGGEKPPVTPLGPWRAGMSLRETFESFPPAGTESTRLRLLRDNSNAWIERWRLLAASKTSIDLSYFILHQDVFGISFLGHLLERARHGVKIRLLLDAHGTKMSWTPLGNDYLDELTKNGNVEIRMFRPLPSRYLEAFLKLSPSAAIASEHDKIIVVDGRESMIGGRNIGAEYFSDPEKEKRAFEDTDLWIESSRTARVLTTAFDAQYESPGSAAEWSEAVDLKSREEELLGAFHAMDVWLREPNEDPRSPWLDKLRKHERLRGKLRAEGAAAIRAETRILDSQTRFDSNADPITKGIIRLVRAAKREILVQSPYLVLSDDAVSHLEAAARRGVKITILTNSPVSSDNALSQAFFLEQWPELLARVPKLRLFVGGRRHTLHSKAAVFDEELALVGTYNLDPTSMAMNSEIVAAVWSRSFARQVAAHPRRMIAAGAPSLYEYRIRRDARGKPLRGDDGKPRIEFGPEQHCSPAEWKSLLTYWSLLRAADTVPGFSPVF
jgi:phosphatidylserine/phosphatidylglycerophosphate/cardiolipin synthase-like enzyme